MLDKKIKDQDASIELLEDRLNTLKVFLFISIIFSGLCFLISTLVVSVSISSAFTFLVWGILLLFASILSWTGLLHYKLYLFMIQKKLVKAEKERK